MSRLMELLSELSIACERARIQIASVIRRAFSLPEDAVREQTIEALRADVDALKGILLEKVKQDDKEFLVTRDIAARLEWHEIKGPLAESKAKLDKKRNKGIILLSDPNRNGH